MMEYGNSNDPVIPNNESPRHALEQRVPRRCMKAGCERTFKVPEESPQRFCCEQHNPNAKAEAKWKQDQTKRIFLATRDKMVATVKELSLRGLTAPEIAKELNQQGFKVGTGRPVSVAYLYNFFRWHGIKRPQPKEESVEEKKAPEADRIKGVLEELEEEKLAAAKGAVEDEEEPEQETDLDAISDRISADRIIPRKSPKARIGNGRLSPVEIVVLQDDDLTCEDKVQILKTYGGIK